MYPRLFIRQIIFIVAFFGLPQASIAEDQASQLFKKFKQQVYQILVVDIASGNKNSIGSGFQISSEGHLATNFHVISSFVHKPEKYRLEYLAHDESKGLVEVLSFDVVHDLAIVKIDVPQKDYFKINTAELSKGQQIFSMGNPHDLAMLIIEGKYSGLVKESRYKKILFSGSLNPGMSGGPAFDDTGSIIGVNVAKGGEQLSFLVPSVHLQKLYEKVRKKGDALDFEKMIGHDLLADQDVFYRKLLEQDWPEETLGEVTIAGRMDESLKCWGHTRDKEDMLYKTVHKHCQSQDSIYVSGDMYTGEFSYSYEWSETEQLNRFQFYSYLENRFSHASVSTVSDKEDATNYQCEADFLSSGDHSWRVSTCMRAYKKYKGLYDVLFLMTTTDMNDKSLLLKTAMSGVSKENSTRYIKRFMQEIKWNH